MDSGLLASLCPGMTALARHISVDTRHYFSDEFKESNLALKDTDRVMPGGEGRVRCPRAWPHQLRTRAVRASARRHHDRRARCIAGSGRVTAGRARGAPCPTKHGPGRALGMRYSPWQEPWWNAGRRARPQAEGGASRFLRGATAPAGAGLTTVRLRAFPFLYSFVPYFVIAGLDPAIHAAGKLVQAFH
jgi:hypothetical protein